MRIVIDLQGAQTESRFRGIGRYSLSFTQAIVRNRGNDEIILALSGLFPETIEPLRAAFQDLLPQDMIRVWHAPGPVAECNPDNSLRRAAAEGIREAFLKSLQPDVIVITSLFEGLGDDAVTSVGLFDQRTPVAVILYDLIPLLSPDIHFRTNPIHKNYYHRKMESLKKCSCLLAISESSRQEVLGTGLFAEHQAVTISGASAAWFRVLQLNQDEKIAICRRFGIDKKFIMYTGVSDERKNLPRLIRAYAALPLTLRQSYQLLMVGKMPDHEVRKLEEIAEQQGLGKGEVLFTGFVKDEDLVQLYNACSLFVFPSLHEGLGLPPLEAMACGAPVIAARATSLPEIIDWEEALFDPYSEQEITEKLTQVLSDDTFRSALIEHCFVQVQKFTWDNSAVRALQALQIFNSHKSAADKYHKQEKEIISDLLQWLAALKGIARSSSLQQELAKCIDASIPPAGVKRQLLIDVSSLIYFDAKSGIQRVVKSLLKQFYLHPPDDYEIAPVYAHHGTPGYIYANEFACTYSGKKEIEELRGGPISFYEGDIFLGLDFAAHIVPERRDFYKRLRQQGVGVYFVIYDLLPIILPHYFGNQLVKAFQPWLETVVENDGAICISQAVAAELHQWLEANRPHRQRPFQISWFHLGADVENSCPSHGMPSDAGIILAAIQKNISFLMVATIEPRKGHRQTLSAFEELWKQNYSINLVIVGRHGWKMSDFVDRLKRHAQFGKTLFWLEGVSDEYLEKIYDEAHCLIAASEGEGFGLPLIEAAQKGLPIIARDIPVFREVAGDSAFYFSGLDTYCLSNAIKEWLQLYREGRHPTSTGMPYLLWEQSAQQMLSKIDF